ncbi:MAG: DUF3124 domain-containing protein [Rhodoferax sp.]|nr:DUF3124 domain-containing protein [Rhodoferax sp.]
MPLSFFTCSRRLRRVLFSLLLFSSCSAILAFADGYDPPSKGQTVYVPIYSDIKHGNLDKSGTPQMALMSVLVSIRNTDPKNGLRVTKAPFYDTKGRLVKEYITQPITVGPFGTAEIFVEHRETEGGSGANFAIDWSAATPISPPIIEALHTHVRGGFTMSFISRGKVIATH